MSEEDKKAQKAMDKACDKYVKEGVNYFSPIFGNMEQEEKEQFASDCFGSGWWEGYQYRSNHKNTRQTFSRQEVWIKTMDDLPPSGTMVEGYHPDWVDEDFNPEGIRECFWIEDSLLPNHGWQSAKWNNYQDCWDVDEEYIPTHWKRRYPPKPQFKGGDIEKG